MKILLVALNAKFVHTNLAIRYLRSYCQTEFPEILLREFTINEHLPEILAEIYQEQPDIIGFSCYIWNIREVMSLAANLKQILPDCLIVLGGPEVSFDSVDLIRDHPYIDGIVRQEGEEAFLELLRALRDGHLGTIEGVTWQNKRGIIHSDERLPIDNLDTIPFPYGTDEEILEGRVLYYETSRGCPFNCSYCISSTTRGVRWFSLERVKRDLLRLLAMRPKEIKFVDRTFNANPRRMLEIMEFLIKENQVTPCHFEIVADRLNEEIMEFLRTVPSGLFKFEIGVQTCNPEVLKKVNRSMNWVALEHNVKKILEQGRIHVHLDLIAGLPGETYASFADAFNRVYNLAPHYFQLGFLKMLKGPALRRESTKYGYKFSLEPPYEVLANADLSYREIIRLKRIEDLVEKYYNSGDFTNTLGYITRRGWQDDAFKFYEELASYWESRGWHRVQHSKNSLYSMLLEFIQDRKPDLTTSVGELLKFDYLLNYHAQKLPEGLMRVEPPGLKEAFNDFLRREDNRRLYFPELKDTSLAKLKRRLHLEVFQEDVFFLSGRRNYPLSGPYFPVLFKKNGPAFDLGHSSVMPCLETIEKGGVRT